MDSKRCTKCGEVKPLEKFYRNRTRRDGRQTMCALCHNAVRNSNRPCKGGLISAAMVRKFGDGYEALAAAVLRKGVIDKDGGWLMSTDAIWFVDLAGINRDAWYDKVCDRFSTEQSM